MEVQQRTYEKWINLSATVVLLVTTIISLIWYGRITNPKLAFSHSVTIVIAVELMIFVVLLHNRTLDVLRAFFTSATHPLNLALFRIVVFWGIFREVRLATIIPFTRIPAGLQVAPWGMGTVLRYATINQRWATTAAILVLIFSATGLIGLFSRTSALFCFVFGIYALGIPQFYGKVDHYNHLIWFAAILAVSPCGDFLALDSIFAARRRADRGITEPPEPSREYALPLRFAMLLVGIIYFFPGLWKLWDGGLEWVFSDNLQKQLYLFWTWSFKTTWLPSFRIDRHPILCTLGAGSTLLFELLFIFGIFFPRLRKVAAAGGVVFHRLAFKFMRIGFFSLQWSYLALFDWNPVFRIIGHWLYRDDMFFLFDSDCRKCRQTVASLRVFDIFDRVTYINFRDQDAVRKAARVWVHADPTETDVYAVVEKRRWAGFAAYGALARRIPLLWPVIPILYPLLYSLPPITGRGIHRHTPDTRAHAVAGSRPVPAESEGRRAQLSGLVAVGTVLVLICSFCGAHRIASGWPFACYPTFSSPAAEKVETLGMIAETSSGETFPVEIKAINYERLYWLLSGILATRDPLLQQDRLRDLWTFAARSDPALKKATSVQFFRQTLFTNPELWKSNPIDQRLLFELHVSP
jgi:predicted DCC family thiol-disulfide oxidoreductase YuxK